MNHYSTFNTIIGRTTIEPTLENATAFGGAIPLLDYVKKIKLIEFLGKTLLYKNKEELFLNLRIFLGEFQYRIVLEC